MMNNAHFLFQRRPVRGPVALERPAVAPDVVPQQGQQARHERPAGLAGQKRFFL